MLLKHSLKALVLKELTQASQLSFTDLQWRTKSTPGNLGKALERLLAAKYVTKVANKERLSIYKLTVKGNHEFSLYVNALKFN
jgi:DNA-binding MarR family transcriptional regulator